MNIAAVVIARGGSKGIPNKNIINFCGKPLIGWTIEQCLASKNISQIWVSSDSNEILEIAKKYNINTLRRPDILSDDYASSESAWLHAINFIEKKNKVDMILAPQVTSPLRETKDFDDAINSFNKNKFDSMFSANVVEDLLFWQNEDGNAR